MGSIAVPKIATLINRSRTIQNSLKAINKNPAVYNAVAAFLLASALRPALIGCLDFKDKKDKKYSQASAIAAGVIELGATVALFLPINKALSKTATALYQSSNPIFKNNKFAAEQFKSVNNRVLKIIAMIPISLARFALVKPIVNTIFGEKRKQQVVTLVDFAEKTKKGKFEKWV